MLTKELLKNENKRLTDLIKKVENELRREKSERLPSPVKLRSLQEDLARLHSEKVLVRRNLRAFKNKGVNE